MHMRPLLLLSALSFFTLNANAQEDKDTDKSNGIRIGYHMSDMDGSPSFDTRSGYYAGYYRNLIKIPIFSFSVGLEYNTAGAVKDELEVKTGYIALPVNGRLKLGPMFFDLGLDAAFNVSDKVELSGQEVEEAEEAEGYETLGHVGIGVKLWKLGIDARYRVAFTDVYDGYKNTGLQVGLSTFF